VACSCCAFGDTADRQFTREKVAKELQRYRHKGLGRTARLLRDGLAAARLTTGTLLDVGAGVGGLTLALLDQGMTRATVVEASAAYLAAASDEAARRGRSAIVQFMPGDYVTIGPQVPGATVVTLDRVVCCYPSFEPLLEQASRHAHGSVALSYPRDRWFVRLGLRVENLLRRLKGNPFRTVLHPPAQMQQVLERCGFELVSRSLTPSWAADVFVRIPDPARRRSFTIDDVPETATPACASPWRGVVRSQIPAHAVRRRRLEAWAPAPATSPSSAPPIRPPTAG
jgi:magnesium-protoporphyrin O-methyltransferase